MQRYELMRKHYGKVKLASIPSEVRTIWYTKEQEPDPCEVAEEFRFDNEFGNCELNIYENRDFLQFVMKKSAPNDRLYYVIYLYFYDQCTFSDIAIELGISNARAQQLLYKAIFRIKKCCDHYGFTI